MKYAIKKRLENVYFGGFDSEGNATTVANIENAKTYDSRPSASFQAMLLNEHCDFNAKEQPVRI